MTSIKYLIVHCSDSTWGDVSVIERWHKERGWRTIGYHAVVLNGYRSSRSAYDRTADGRIEFGRKLDLDGFISPAEVGAHALGYNSDSIGVCLIGSGNYTYRQLESLRALVTMWARAIPGLVILGHCEVDKNKTCPKLDMNWFRLSIPEE
jgi:hypothetical protein